MKCLLCERYSFYHICKNCQQLYLKPSIYRDRVGGVDVVSFYKYDDIKDLIYTKYDKVGSAILDIVAKNSIAKFIQEFDYSYKTKTIPIDDRVNTKDYSHSAILAKHTKSRYITPYYNKLISQNNYKYAKKNLEDKLKNPRDFLYSGASGIDAILVDDVVTDGVTLNEAQQKLSQFNVKVRFAIVLAYSRGNNR
jgi:competence protein ComFC